MYIHRIILLNVDTVLALIVHIYINVCEIGSVHIPSVPECIDIIFYLITVTHTHTPCRYAHFTHEIMNF